MSWFASVKSLFSSKQSSDVVETYHVAAITNAMELLDIAHLPLEFQFVITKNPERIHQLRDLLEAGYGVGIRTIEQTPSSILSAIDRISQRTQEKTIIPWLPRLLNETELPSFTEFELRTAEREGISLYEEAKYILEQRYEFKKMIVIDLHNKGIGSEVREFMVDLNKELYSLATDYMVHSVLHDTARAKTKIMRSVGKAIFLVGPISHVLERWVHGAGKLFAATADDVMAETVEVFSLRGSGFAWHQLIRHSKIFIPVFALATYTVFQIDALIQAGNVALAGVVFGCAAVAFSLTEIIRSVFFYKKCYQRLRKMLKIDPRSRYSDVRLAMIQIFSNPMRFGLLIGVLSVPVLAGLTFVFFTPHVNNGWVLALLGSMESIIAGITVFLVKRIKHWKFKLDTRQAIRALSRSMKKR